MDKNEKLLVNQAYEETLKLYKNDEDLLRRHINFYARYGIMHCEHNYMFLASLHDEQTWYIHLAVGRGALSVFRHCFPFSLPFVAWRRGFNGDNRLRVHKWDTLERIIDGQRHIKRNGSAVEVSGLRNPEGSDRGTGTDGSAAASLGTEAERYRCQERGD